MQQVLRTYRPWFIRLVDAIIERWRDWHRGVTLRELDPRTLADIGIDASEISAIAAEASARARLTSLRVAVHGYHG